MQSVTQAPEAPPTPPEDVIIATLGKPLALHETDETYIITADDLGRFERFQNRTVYTLGTAQTVEVYRQAVVKLGCEHSYLTHIVFAIVLMHDRYLSDNPWAPPSHAESFHHYHGTAIFNATLQRAPLPEAEKDAMWGCAALLAAMTIASIDATTPDEAWPLAAPSLSNLDWLRMSDGKKEVWKLADPLRENSCWRPALIHEHEKDPRDPSIRKAEWELLLPTLTKLFNYNTTNLSQPTSQTPPPTTAAEAEAEAEAKAEAQNNPYHTALTLLLNLLPLQCTHTTILYFLSFLGHMDPRYRALLHAKDPKALVLLAWWYAKVLDDYPVWWLRRRGTLECKAICLFLWKRFSYVCEFGRLADYPRRVVGLGVNGDYEREVALAGSVGMG
ncbi:hypothetical protein B0A50_04838 [Salinomyces thailandicus]|uniref:Uncharacterized protein n=1 Tax=Salinomyces thailandicus TaxID=706561 RepID=A0A4U0TZ53_9PEZI|nr:hypothetical protein B0A50_04838 [Salinomyces thailandica]